MSALAHYLETAGIATVAISLVRPQTEKTRPPRALWVPFELGRPFGPPSDRSFQLRVVRAALALLESDRGPVLLADFPDDDPRAAPDPGWYPPIVKAIIPDHAPATLAAQLAAEIPKLEAAYHRAQARLGRTTVGLSDLPIDVAGRYVGAFLKGEAPASPRPDLSPALLMRFAVDDLKAYYSEAAIADGSKPSSRQIGDWFWHDTAAGATIAALRAANLSSPDDRLKLIATMFLVPGARVPLAG